MQFKYFSWLLEKKSVFYLGLGAVGLAIVTIVRRSKERHKLPPGPWGIPFIGAPFQLSTDIPTCLNRIKHLRNKYGDVFSLYIGNNLMVVVNGYTAIKEAFIQAGTTFAGRPTNMWKISPSKFPLYTDDVFMSDYSEEWKAHKKFALVALRKFDFGLPSLEGKVIKQIDKLSHRINNTKNREPINISLFLMQHLTEIVSCITISRGEENVIDKDLLIKLHTEGGSTCYASLFMPPWLRNWYYRDFYERSTVLFERTMSFMRDKIRQHRATLDVNNPRDLLDVYLINRSEITEDHLCSTLSNLQIDAIFTTSEAILALLAQMIIYPEVQTKIHRELDHVVGKDEFVSLTHKPDLTYLQATILESLRYSAMIPFGFPHKATRDASLQGYFIPEGSTLIMNIHSVHNDEGIFPEPGKFDPNNFLNKDGTLRNQEYCIPFSVGRRMCIGESLAKMEIFLFFANLMKTFEVELGPDSASPERCYYSPGFFQLYKPFQLCLIPRKTQSVPY